LGAEGIESVDAAVCDYVVRLRESGIERGHDLAYERVPVGLINPRSVQKGLSTVAVSHGEFRVDS
jgi:hypothetical protein